MTDNSNLDNSKLLLNSKKKKNWFLSEIQFPTKEFEITKQSDKNQFQFTSLMLNMLNYTEV